VRVKKRGVRVEKRGAVGVRSWTLAFLKRALSASCSFVALLIGDLFFFLFWQVGYRYVWLFLVGCTLAGTALLGPKIYKELFVEHAASPLAATGSGKGYQSVGGKEATRQMV
jgi:hypothetical protein